MFKALLLAAWYDLSDVRLAEALEDRASFCRFCGFARGEATPGRIAFVRFRRLLVALGLDQSLFEAVTRDLEKKALIELDLRLATIEGEDETRLSHIDFSAWNGRTFRSFVGRWSRALRPAVPSRDGAPAIERLLAGRPLDGCPRILKAKAATRKGNETAKA